MHENPVTEERVAENEVRFRLANERIQKTAREYGVDDGPIPFLCECADSGCTAIVRVGLEDYETVRREPTHFLHLPGHESPAESARVVTQAEGYIVVAKLGAGGQTAASQDPRAE